MEQSKPKSGPYKYRNIEKHKAYMKEYNKTYRQRPEAKLRKAQLRKTEEYRRKRNEYLRGKGERKRRDWQLQFSYGITLDEYEKMFSSQGGKCALCGKDGKLVVDHCHKTGLVRGLIHRKCNSAIGLFEDNPEMCVMAANYLINSRKES